MAENPEFAATAYAKGSTITDADGTNPVVAAEGTSSDLVLRSLRLANNGSTSTDYDIDVFLRISAVEYQVCRVTVPFGAGYDPAKPPVQVLDPAVLPGLGTEPNNTMELPAAVTVKIAAAAALAAGDVVTCLALGGLV